MKKIFFFALASLALASCSQDDEFVAENQKGSSNRANTEALSFSTYTAGGTRATDVTSAEVVTSGFKVAAWYDGDLYFKAGETAGYTEDISGNKIFDTETDTYFWPSFGLVSDGAGGSKVSPIGFRAFNQITGAEWEDEYNKVKYPIATTAAAQEDLVIAYAEATSKPTDGIQPLNFTHALSKVNFSFVAANPAYKYTINKVEVIAAGKPSGSNTAPIMSFEKTTELAAGKTDGDAPVNSQADVVTWDYEAIDYSSTKPLVKKSAGAAENQGVLYTYYDADATSADPEFTNDANSATIVSTDQNLMLLPQKGKIAVRVYYKVESLKEDNSTTPSTFTVNKLIGNCGYTTTDVFGHHGVTPGIRGFKTALIDLSTDAVEWKAGNAYRFTMTLPADNFIGDRSGDEVPDMDATVDLDGDGDTDNAEFDQLTPIRFSVTVSNWETETAATAVTVK